MITSRELLFKHFHKKFYKLPFFQKHMNISVVIPAKNEQENLPIVLDKILKLGLEDYEIVIVVDESSDKTNHVADSYAKKYKSIRVIKRKSKIKGFGAAIKEGTKSAKGDYIVW